MNALLKGWNFWSVAVVIEIRNISLLIWKLASILQTGTTLFNWKIVCHSDHLLNFTAERMGSGLELWKMIFQDPVALGWFETIFHQKNRYALSYRSLFKGWGSMPDKFPDTVVLLVNTGSYPSPFFLDLNYSVGSSSLPGIAGKQQNGRAINSPAVFALWKLMP